jgi:hypothetical protein
MKSKLVIIYRIFITLFFIAFVSFAIKECGFYQQLKSNHKESVAVIVDIRTGYKFHKFYEYSFSVNGKVHFNTEEMSEETHLIQIGQKYIVLYLPEDPQVCKLKRDKNNYLIQPTNNY